MAEPAPDRGGLADARRFLTFRLAGELYALPADEVSEVIRIPPVARVPQAPKALMGLANLRGAVLPLASGRSLVGKASGEPSRAIVLAGASTVALAVDAVEGLVSVAGDGIETRQAELAAEPGEQLAGAFAMPGGGGVAKVLDVWPLLEAAFVQAPRPPRTGGGVSAGVGREHTSAADHEHDRLVTFDVAGQEFALPLEAVQEIVPMPERLAAAPRAEALVIGVAAHRNSLLPLLSLRGLLGLPAAPGDGREKVLVTRMAGVLVGLVADRMRAIVPADPALIDPTPPMLAARTGGESRIKAIYRGEGGRRLISILAPEQLFREDVMQRLGGGQAAAPEPDGDAAETQSLRFLVFRLGDDEFALPIEVVDEVARAPDQVTRVPKAPKFLEGVVNLRGEVLPVVDQRRRFDMPPAPAREARRLIVMRTERHRAGLIVDSVSEVLRSSPEAIEPAPDLTGEGTRLVSGVINLEAAGRIVMLLDPVELLTRTERGLLDAFQAGQSDGEPPASVIRVLVVDDSALVRKLLGQVLSAQADMEVETARDGLDALEKIRTFDPQVVTLDIHMPGLDGLACLDRIMLEHPRPVVMVSSVTAEGAEVTLEALRLGAVDFVAKPGGAVSLRIDELAGELVAKVRSAAGARLRLASRLRDRVRHKIGRAAAPAADEPFDADFPPEASPAAEGIVLVGTSTGGPPALEALLTPLPADFPWPIVVAQHMPRSFTGALARRLDGICEITVCEVARPTPLAPGHAYIGRGDADVIVSRRAGGLVAMAAPSQADYPWHPSTDRLVRSAMDHLPAKRLIGVLMTGMGDDGAAAMTRLRANGGRTIAEAEETAVVWGMPGELVKMGGATATLPLPRIADRLRRLVR